MTEPSEPTPSPPVISYQSPGIAAHRWKTVWHAANPMEANLAVGKLQDRGLHARVDFENTAALGIDAYAPGGSAVQVFEDEFPDARLIINEIEQRRRRRLDAQSVPCPYCNAAGARHVIHPIRKIGLLAALGAGVLAAFQPVVPIPLFLPICIGLAGVAMIFWPMLPQWQCVSCGRRFLAKEPPPADEEEDDEADDEADD